MPTSLVSLVAISISIFIGAAGCAGRNNTAPIQPQPSPSPIAIPAAPIAAEATGSGKPSGSARYPYTAADIRFMSGMIGHHSQAIVMATMAPSHGANDQIRTLAERIINAQRDEIASMQTWLRDRKQPVPSPDEPDTMVNMKGMNHDMLMPGMLTPPQLAQLDASRGKEFDRLFLTFMIQHHRGAVSMVEKLFATNGAAQDETIFKLANDINVDQQTEIDRMEGMLASQQSH